LLCVGRSPTRNREELGPDAQHAADGHHGIRDATGWNVDHDVGDLAEFFVCAVAYVVADQRVSGHHLRSRTCVRLAPVVTDALAVIGHRLRAGAAGCLSGRR
jgi:hypothetical protein